MLNGGGGEVFRNFFYLPDRAYAARELIWTFYSQFDPRVGGERFDEEAYLSGLETKLRRVLGVETGPLDRMAVECAYPAFRCRFWMGKNNSVNNRLGFALTPFIDANIVPDALAAPLSYKDHGRLEAGMIKAINPKLAAYVSAYGHGLDGEPPLSRKLKDRSTYLRPPWVRRYTFRLKNRQPQARPYWLQPDYLGRVVDLDFPYARRLFDIERVFDNGQFNRMATLEFLFQRINAGIADSKLAAAA
jgi:asparagine synthase (glutamine-hydrolysing)